MHYATILYDQSLASAGSDIQGHKLHHQGHPTSGTEGPSTACMKLYLAGDFIGAQLLWPVNESRSSNHLNRQRTILSSKGKSKVGTFIVGKTQIYNGAVDTRLV